MMWFSDDASPLETEVLTSLSNILTGGKLSTPRGGPSLDSRDVALCAIGSVAHPVSTAATSAPIKVSVRSICLRPLRHDLARVFITFNAPTHQSAGFEVEFPKEDALSEPVLMLRVAVCQRQRFRFRLSIPPISVSPLTYLGILRVHEIFARIEKGCSVKRRSADGADR
jgi:hypothetical protein